MAVEVSGEPRSMTSSLAKLTFSRKEFMHWVSRRNTVSSRPNLTNSDFDGFKKDRCQRACMGISLCHHTLILDLLQSWHLPNTRC